LNDRVEEVKETMIENIDKVLERGEKLEDVQASSEQLMSSAALMNRKTRTIKRNTIWRWVLLAIIIILLLIAILVVIIVVPVCRKYHC
jgi:t-SNARE complex subunit (syntaxin)